MKTARTNEVQQLRKLAQFLDEHPQFSPLFSGDAILFGFQLGESHPSLLEMDLLIGAESEVAAASSGVATSERTCAL